MEGTKPGGWSRADWILNSLLLCIPAAMLLFFLTTYHVLIFTCACIAIIPLANLMGKATEEIAHRLGSGLGGFMNATFGNAAELIIGLIALKEGNIVIVKASITGSIIGNILFVLGLSVLIGGIRNGRQTFNLTAASASSSTLLLSVCALAIPALFHLFIPTERLEPIELHLSVTISIILLLLYGCSLLFSLKTHSHLYRGKAEHPAKTSWTLRRAVWVLVGSTVFVGAMAEILVHSLDETVSTIGFTETFVGVIIIAIIGNAAEHSTAVLMAWKDQMNLSLTIAMESSKQIALFVAPVLVLFGLILGTGTSTHRMNLDFNPLEVVAVTFSVLMVSSICHDGESHWLEGALLLGVYAILAAGFFFIP